MSTPITQNDEDKELDAALNAFTGGSISKEDQGAFALGVLASHISSSNKISQAHEAVLDEALASIKAIDARGGELEDAVRADNIRSELSQ